MNGASAPRFQRFANNALISGEAITVKSAPQPSGPTASISLPSLDEIGETVVVTASLATIHSVRDLLCRPSHTDTGPGEGGMCDDSPKSDSEMDPIALYMDVLLDDDTPIVCLNPVRAPKILTRTFTIPETAAADEFCTAFNGALINLSLFGAAHRASVTHASPPGLLVLRPRVKKASGPRVRGESAWTRAPLWSSDAWPALMIDRLSDLLPSDDQNESRFRLLPTLSVNMYGDWVLAVVPPAGKFNSFASAVSLQHILIDSVVPPITWYISVSRSQLSGANPALASRLLSAACAHFDPDLSVSWMEPGLHQSHWVMAGEAPASFSPHSSGRLVVNVGSVRVDVVCEAALRSETAANQLTSTATRSIPTGPASRSPPVPAAAAPIVAPSRVSYASIAAAAPDSVLADRQNKSSAVLAAGATTMAASHAGAAATSNGNVTVTASPSLPADSSNRGKRLRSDESAAAPTMRPAPPPPRPNGSEVAASTAAAGPKPAILGRREKPPTLNSTSGGTSARSVPVSQAPLPTKPSAATPDTDLVPGSGPLPQNAVAAAAIAARCILSEQPTAAATRSASAKSGSAPAAQLPPTSATAKSAMSTD